MRQLPSADWFQDDGRMALRFHNGMMTFLTFDEQQVMWYAVGSDLQPGAWQVMAGCF